MVPLHTLTSQSWDESFSDIIKNDAIHTLENGQIIFLPQLAFSLSPEEQVFLSPEYADPQAKNISYHAKRKKLWGFQRLTDKKYCQLKCMMDRYSRYAQNLIKALFPAYADHLIIARTSFRPIEISGRKTSFLKDDKLLHVDSFPSDPNQGKRILRVFCNINSQQKERVWRVGEPFREVVERFLPKLTKPFPGCARALRLLKITKSYRTLYDHYMLQLHNQMKRDVHYQKEARQHEMAFPSGSVWIVQTDDVSHAAMAGQHVLEQTFYLPIEAMQNEKKSPLRILEQALHRPLR
jgi:hypothetical protein